MSVNLADSSAAQRAADGRLTTSAAVMRGPNRPWEIVELQLDPPKEYEVLIRYVAAGLCHSDEHLRTDNFWNGMARFPIVGGHEGAGVVEAVGPSVSTVRVGDHVVCSYVPVCGRCRWCSTGHQNLCDLGATTMEGCLTDGTFRFHDADGQDYGGNCMLGTFSQYGVVSQYSLVPIEKDLALDVAVLVGCGVPTGWGSAVYNAKVEPGETVIIYGVGGIGMNAVQGARYAGASAVIAVDPLAFKRETALSMGATHVAETAEEGHRIAQEITVGVGADKAIITTGVVDKHTVRAAFDAIRKAGTLTITGLAPVGEDTIELPSGMLTLWEKKIQGALFGSSNPMYDIKKMLRLYRQGELKLDELVTQRYRLDQINDAYQDLADGKNIRGVITY